MISGMPLFLCLRLISCLSGIFFGRFLGSEGSAIITTPEFFFLVFVFLVSLILVFRIQMQLSKKHKNLFVFGIFLGVGFFSSLFRVFLFEKISAFFGFGVSTLILNVSSSSGSNESCVSNPPANEGAAPEEPASHAPVNPFPYQADEVIGGDSVLSIQQRLLQKFGNPSSEEIDRARIEAEDLFEVKVDIIRQMETLDPGGDWERRGARALDNPRTATGEELLERLYEIRDNLNRDGIQSPTFRSLQLKVVRRV